MKLKTKAEYNQFIDVNVDVITFLEDLFNKEFNERFSNIVEYVIDEEKNELYFLYDQSYHGSPYYEKFLITNDKIKIEKFKHLYNLIYIFKFKEK